MHRLSKVSGVCLLAAALATVSAQEEKTGLDKVPKAALDVVKTKYPGAKLLGAAKEKDGDKFVYEISLTYKDHHHDVTLEADGKIVSIERQIPRKELPPAVDQTVESKYPKADWKIIEELYKGDGTLSGYEVHLVTTGNEVVEVVLDPQGKITKEERPNPKKDGKAKK